jgi:hypothetical protein
VVAVPGSASPWGGYPVIAATGTGTRGAIFGAYAFSERVLGVNPWHLFNDDPPTYAGSVTVNASAPIVYPPPLYKYRAWFTNDEDLLGYGRCVHGHRRGAARIHTPLHPAPQG